jgi:hypothetical protein
MERFRIVRKIKSLAVVAAAVFAVVLLAGVSTVHAVPTVTNGSFDVVVPTNGSGGGWTAGNNTVGYQTGPANDVTFTNFFIINASGEVGSDPFILQVIGGFEVGKTYRITGDYENAFNGVGNSAALSFGVEIVEQGLLTQFAQPPADGPGSFSVDFVAALTTLTLRLTAERNGDDSSYGIDNIAIADLTPGNGPVGVPEPTVLGVLGLGLVGLTRLRRRV